MRTRPWFREISLVLRPLAWQMFLESGISKKILNRNPLFILTTGQTLASLSFYKWDWEREIEYFLSGLPAGL